MLQLTNKIAGIGVTVMKLGAQAETMIQAPTIFAIIYRTSVPLYIPYENENQCVDFEYEFAHIYCIEMFFVSIIIPSCDQNTNY